MTYTFVCNQGHDPITMSVEAENDEAALPQMFAKAKEHLTSMHSEGPQMTDDQVIELIKSSWTKA